MKASWYGVVIAETLHAARAAAELVIPEFEELTAVVATGEAASPDSPQIYPADGRSSARTVPRTSRAVGCASGTCTAAATRTATTSR